METGRGGTDNRGAGERRDPGRHWVGRGDWSRGGDGARETFKSTGITDSRPKLLCAVCLTISRLVS